jgi:hypothetical protein
MPTEDRIDKGATKLKLSITLPVYSQEQTFEQTSRTAAASASLGRIDAVHLEHVLGDIQTDRGNLHVDGSLM